MVHLYLCCYLHGISLLLLFVCCLLFAVVEVLGGLVF